MTHMINRMRAVHPGEVLLEEYLVPLGLSARALASALGVPATRIRQGTSERPGLIGLNERSQPIGSLLPPWIDLLP